MEPDEYFMGQSKAENQTASSWSAVKVEDPATSLRRRVVSPRGANWMFTSRVAGCYDARPN